MTEQTEVISDVTQEVVTDPAVEAAKVEDAKVEPEVEARVVPESYEFTDIDSAIPEVIDAYKDAAKEFGLTNKEAQGILSKVLPEMAAQQEAQHKAMVEGWANETKADKEIGGAKLDQNLAVASKAVKAFGGDGLVEFLNSSGLGNHPLLVKAFYNAGMKISEDNQFISGGSGTKNPSIAQAMFPNMNP